MAVDAFSKWGLEPAALSPETVGILDQVLPPYWSRNNPVDILGDAPPERYLAAVRGILAAPEVSGVLVLLSPQAMTDPTGVAQALAPEIKKQAKPVFAVWMGAQDVAPGIQVLNEAGIPRSRPPRQRWIPSWRCTPTPVTWNCSRKRHPGSPLI